MPYTQPHTRANSYNWFCKHNYQLVIGALVLTWLLGGKVNALRAQDQDGPFDSIGIPTYTATLPVENGFIKTSNGALHLEIPLGVSVPQRGGHQFKAALVYDSNIWYYSVPTNIPEADIASMGGYYSLGGWRLYYFSLDYGTFTYT